MSEAKDPAIKLFGKTIPLAEIPAPASVSVSGGAPSPPPHPPTPPDPPVDESLNQDRPSSPNSSPEDDNSNRVGEDHEPDKASSGGSLRDTKQEDEVQPLTSEKIADTNATAVVNENPKTTSVDNEAATKTSKTEEEQSETSNPQEKTLKKPDKILPCPRCNSMDTKFCYYNNYNVNQPRHFCKNCQRYWTAGGTMRNVPVGAGRRKNKNSASRYHHITVSEALQNARADLPNGIHHPALKPNGTLLTFGLETHLFESMAPVLNIAEKTMQNCARNGFRKPEELRIPVSYGGGENGDDHSSGSSVTAANSKDDVGKAGLLQDPVMRNYHSFPAQVPCFPGAPWPYPWNTAQWSSPVPPPAFCPPGFPMPFYPAPPYWGCTVPGTWNVPWVTPPTSYPNHTAPGSGPNSPTLGKHSRDENALKQSNSGEEEPQKENNPERCLWIPKTLRIDDPAEAARSSIWATLGIKHDKADSISGGGLFKAFQSKGDEKNHISETSPVLQANPAALSRSQNFHESS